MTPHSAEARIYDILTTHDIPISKEDITWVFSSSKTATEVEEYVERYLREECLLSLEEAEIYEHIKATHLLKLHKSRDLAQVNPDTDEGLKLEIERLKVSTVSFQKQSELLRKQRDVLEGLKKREKQVEENRKKLRERRRRKWLGEREKLMIDIDNLIIALRHQIQDLQHEGKQSTGPPTSTSSTLLDLESLQNLLSSDDKILKKLERLADETDVGDIDGSKEEIIVEKVRKMTERLSVLLTTMVRHRLDRLYVETLGSPVAKDDALTEDEKQYISTLKADLEALDAEIPAVSKMSTEGEFLRPVLGEVKKRKSLVGEIVGSKGGYIRDVLQHLQKRNLHIIQQLEQDIYKKKALHELSTQLEHISKTPLPPRLSRDRDGNKTPPHASSGSSVPRTPGRASTSPTKHLPAHLRRPQQPSPATPRRTTGKFRSPRKLSNEEDDDKDEDAGEPEIDLLLHLGITLPLHLSEPQTPGTPFTRREVPAVDNDSVETQKHLLKQFVSMNNRIMQQETGIEKILRGAITSSITESASVARIASSVLWSDKPFGMLEKANSQASSEGNEGTLDKLIPDGLLSEDVTKKLGEVEKGVEKLSEKMEKVVNAVEVLEESNGAGMGVGAVDAKLRFVRRWGR